MDKQLIQQDIHNILKEEIPDDMNILPDIHQRLQTQSTPKVHSLITWSRLVAVIGIFVMVGAGGYALIQRNLVSKDIPQQIVTDINETQTIEGVAVTLNWAYADAHRIALAYSMEYQPTHNFINAPVVTLKTSDGIELPQELRGGGGGGGGSSQTVVSETLLNYDTSVITGLQSTLDLIFTLDFSADAVLSNPTMAHMTRGGMSSVGGGGRDGTSSTGGGGGGNAPMPTPDVSNLIDRVYTFSFSLPFYQAQDVTAVADTVESNDITMMVKNIRYTPSRVQFELCYNMPDDEIWGAQIQIIADSPDSPFYTRQLRPIQPELEQEHPCFDVSASAAIPDTAQEFMIDVMYLSRPIQPLTQSAATAEEAYFADLGYIIEIDADETGYSLDILKFPEDTTEMEAQGYIQANLFFHRYEGDWTFTVLSG